ncbi:hypothetical protein ACP70R_042402 [Stipagrostis hirtigluma subsp. patula]
MPPPPSSSPPSRLLPNLAHCSRRTAAAATAAAAASPPGHGRRPLRYAVLGAGFAGLSVAWHLLKQSPRDARVTVDIYDENGVGGGASGVSGGLLHPYSPKGGILRPPTNEKAADILLEMYMPLALNINPKKYLQALFLACQNLADEAFVSSSEQKELKLYNEHIDNLHQLAGDYDSVIICLGANASSLPELANKLPLRTCRGVIAEFQLPPDAVEEYDNQSPSILSDAWLAFQGPRNVSIGSTWQWKSENYASTVSDEEAVTAMEELLPKASGVYPGISKWDFVRARAGIRAMPPLTANGSLPLLGCLNDVMGGRSNCTFWLVGGLGARGLSYHGLVGKLTAEAAISCDENVIPSEFTCWKGIKPSR